MNVYLYPSNTETELQNAYIGEYKGWKPGANTVMYYPFKDDQLDKIGNSSLSVTGTKQSLGYNFVRTGEMLVNNPSTNCRFVSFWIKRNGTMGSYTQSPSTYIGRILYNFQHVSSSYTKRFEIKRNGYNESTSSQINTSMGTRYHFAMGYDGTTVRAYLNGTKVREQNVSSVGTENMRFGYDIDMDVSEYIGESVCWTAEEVYNYYNLTKSNYGL